MSATEYGISPNEIVRLRRMEDVIVTVYRDCGEGWPTSPTENLSDQAAAFVDAYVRLLTMWTVIE